LSNPARIHPPRTRYKTHTALTTVEKPRQLRHYLNRMRAYMR
jgi:hypothetical protein